MGTQIPELDSFIGEARILAQVSEFHNVLGNLERELETLKRRGDFVIALAQMSAAAEVEQARIAAEASWTVPDGQLIAVRWRQDSAEPSEVSFMYEKPGSHKWSKVSPGALGIADGHWFAGKRVGLSIAGFPFIETTTPNGATLHLNLVGDDAADILDGAKLVPEDSVLNGYDYRESA